MNVTNWDGVEYSLDDIESMVKDAHDNCVCIKDYIDGDNGTTNAIIMSLISIIRELEKQNEIDIEDRVRQSEKQQQA
jgi:hypothetical protein